MQARDLHLSGLMRYEQTEEEIAACIRKATVDHVNTAPEDREGTSFPAIFQCGGMAVTDATVFTQEHWDYLAKYQIISGVQQFLGHFRDMVGKPIGDVFTAMYPLGPVRDTVQGGLDTITATGRGMADMMLFLVNPKNWVLMFLLLIGIALIAVGGSNVLGSMKA